MRLSMNESCRRDNGFTLVELALVMLVIGALVGGVLYGMQLRQNSRLLGTYAKVKAFSLATEEFIKQNGALPGDMPNARSRIAACGGAPAGACANGNGNASVGLGDNTVDIFDTGALGTEDDETTYFWYHLQAAGLINEVDVNTPLAAANPWGVSHPAAPAGGGYHVRTMGGFKLGVNGEQIKGLFVRWQATPFQAANAGGIFVVSPSEAMTMDVKYDDGRPLTGNVQSRGTNAALNANDGCRADGANYIQNGTTLTCYMYFRIRNFSGL